MDRLRIRLDAQQALQDEAAAVLDDLELLPLLKPVGDPVKVGSLRSA